MRPWCRSVPPRPLFKLFPTLCKKEITVKPPLSWRKMTSRRVFPVCPCENWLYQTLESLPITTFRKLGTERQHRDETIYNSIHHKKFNSLEHRDLGDFFLQPQIKTSVNVSIKYGYSNWLLCWYFTVRTSSGLEFVDTIFTHDDSFSLALLFNVSSPI